VEISPEVMAPIRNGNKIEAIKALRNASGLDLKAAKAAVEAIEDSAR
jgi:ribosomal protein L7/L12